MGFSDSGTTQEELLGGTKTHDLRQRQRHCLPTETLEVSWTGSKQLLEAPCCVIGDPEELPKQVEKEGDVFET